MADKCHSQTNISVLYIKIEETVCLTLFLYLFRSHPADVDERNGKWTELTK